MDVGAHLLKRQVLGAAMPLGAVCAFADDGDFESVSPPGFDVYTLSYTHEHLAEIARLTGLPEPSSSLSPEGKVFAADSRALAALRTAVATSLETLCTTTGDRAARDAAHRCLVESVPEALLAALTGAAPVHRTVRPSRERLLERALEYLDARLEDAPSVLSIARATGVTSRALEYAFRDHFDVTPKAYLMALRLDRTRYDLRHAPPGARVADVANRWGFWHMGQFAADYRKRFGELPSHTLGAR